MKVVYDITTPGLPKYPHLGGPNEKMIRCVYDMTGVLSSLVGIHLSDGVHLKLSAKPGIEHETATNPIHHHVSILSANPIPYAAKFNTKKFIIEYRKYNRETFLQQRFPTWTLTGYSAENYPIMELAVV